MNSSTNRIGNIIIDCSIISLTSISICISTVVFGFIVYYLIKIKNSPNQLALLLTGNVYLSILFSCILLLKEYIHVLPGHIYSINSLNDGIYCEVRAYFLWASNCTIYYSTTLQSFHRLCRIVFHNRRSLQSIKFYQILILIQWIICFLIMIPGLLLGYFKYSNNDYLCQVDYTSLKNTCINGMLSYAFPVYATMGCYYYTLRKVRKRNHNLVQASARRDLIVLFRICILVGLLMIIPVPTMIGFFIYFSSGYLPWWLSQFQWFAFSLITNIATIILILISPHVRILWTKTFHHPRHHPAAIVFANKVRN
ncbi:unnamed protein product [Adineta steineri]|uniref:G-protein coupled receptors family 1 profile domain-containing protein n=2 Tax=Adineta steineri TaxID=433720 RepID=A0A813X0X0_9BILA|nr:unnamed protein product [Adineta steineri]